MIMESEHNGEMTETADYGYSDVEIARVGDFYGSDEAGQPIPEHFTEENLKNIVDTANLEGKEILVDKQHNSMKSGAERDDSACGWLQALSFRNGSIFGRVFWTKLGHELVKSRIFRFISPVFRLKENGEPDKLINIALVNQPAITGMKPIVNHQNEDILTMDITKEELTELIKSTVAAMNSAPTTEVKSEEETKEVESAEAETTEAENNCTEVEKTKNETPETTEGETKESAEAESTEAEPEKKEETTVEESAEAEIKEEPEVIKESALNQAPTTNIPSPSPEWTSLTGKAFRDWCDKNSSRLNEMCRQKD